MIIEKYVVGPWATNCYIVGSESDNEGMVIDPGDEVPVILKGIRDLGIDIKIIVLTHGHSDHFQALSDIQEETSAKCAIHKIDSNCLRGKALSWSSMFGLSFRMPLSLDLKLEEGDRITVGRLDFQVLHTPGHTPGGICLFGEGVVFTGDTLFRKSIGTTFTYGSSTSRLINSIHTKLMALPDEIIVYPGHGSQTTIGNERHGNPHL